MTTDLLLAIDVGTQSVRALAFDRDGHDARPRAGAVRAAVRLAAAGLGREGRRVVLAGPGRGLSRPLAAGRRRAGADRRPGPHHAARHRRLRARGRHAAPAGDRLARPAPQHRAAAAGPALDHPVRPRRRRRADPPAAAPGRMQLAGAARARSLARVRALLAALRLADAPPGRRVGRFGRLPGRLPAVRLQAAAVGQGRRVALEGAGDPQRAAAAAACRRPRSSAASPPPRPRRSACPRACR